MSDDIPKLKRKRWRWIIAGVLLFVAAVAVLRDALTPPVERAKSLRVGMTKNEVRRIMGPIRYWFSEGRTEGNVTVSINADCYTTDSQFVGVLEVFGLRPRQRLKRTEYPIEIQYDQGGLVTSVRVPPEN